MTMAADTRTRRIVVAGGTGFIGRALCRALAADGCDVVVLSRHDGVALPGTRRVRWDPSAAGRTDWIDALRDADAVVNLCGASIAGPRWTAARKRVLRDSRVDPATALVRACASLDHPPARLLQASGVGYVGTGDLPCDETSARGHDFLAELAGVWEAAVADCPVPCAVLRFGVVLGHGGALPQMLLPFRLFAGGPIGSGRQWLSWIHVDDAVTAIRFVIDRDLTGVVNVTAPTPVHNRTFAAVAGTVLRRPAWFPTPAWLLRLALGEQAVLVCAGQQVLPARLTALGFEFRHPTLESALRDLCR